MGTWQGRTGRVDWDHVEVVLMKTQLAEVSLYAPCKRYQFSRAARPRHYVGIGLARYDTCTFMRSQELEEEVHLLNNEIVQRNGAVGS